jgi:hypothetical protein
VGALVIVGVGVGLLVGVGVGIGVGLGLGLQQTKWISAQDEVESKEKPSRHELLLEQ